MSIPVSFSRRTLLSDTSNAPCPRQFVPNCLDTLPGRIRRWTGQAFVKPPNPEWTTRSKGPDGTMKK